MNWTPGYSDQPDKKLSMSGYAIVYKMMNHVLTNLKDKPLTTLKPGSIDWETEGISRSFDQSEFFGTDFAKSGFHKTGYLYFPNACLKKSCKLVSVLHGCTQEVSGGYGFSWIR